MIWMHRHICEHTQYTHININDPNEDEAVIFAPLLLSSFILDPNGDADTVFVFKDDDPNGELLTALGDELLVENDVLPNGEDFFSSSVSLSDVSTVVTVLVEDPNGDDAFMDESSFTDDSSFFSSLSPPLSDFEEIFPNGDPNEDEVEGGDNSVAVVVSLLCVIFVIFTISILTFRCKRIISKR